MWTRRLTLALAALALTAGNAWALELSMTCENPGRIYVAHVDREANTFRIEAAGEITQYQVREFVDIDVGFIVRGTTVDGGPDFAAHLWGDPRIEFLVDGEIVQTDDCLQPESSLAADPVMIPPDRFTRDARRLPASVQEVASGGHWSEGEAEGFFRIVVLAAGVEHTVHKLFVQLIAVSNEDQDTRLVSSVAVEEFNEGHGVTLEVVPYFVERLTAEIRAFPRGGGHGQRYVLKIMNDGSYELTPG